MREFCLLACLLVCLVWLVYLAGYQSGSLDTCVPYGRYYIVWPRLHTSGLGSPLLLSSPGVNLKSERQA